MVKPGERFQAIADKTEESVVVVVSPEEKFSTW